MTHTPGPWKIQYGGISDSDEGFGGCSEMRPGAGIVAECWPGFTTVESRREILCNARLVAAAPELLETLKELLAYANGYSDKMLEIGRGAEQLGEGADSVSIAGRARALINRIEMGVK